MLSAKSQTKWHRQAHHLRAQSAKKFAKAETVAKLASVLRGTRSYSKRKIQKVTKITPYRLTKLIKSNYDPMSLLSCTDSKNLNNLNQLQDLNSFLEFFNRSKTAAVTAAQLHQLSLEQLPLSTPSSLQKFRRTRLLPLGIRCKTCKHLNYSVDTPIVAKNRAMFLQVFKELAIEGAEFIFVDESSFEVRYQSQRGYERPGFRPTFKSRSYPIVVKLTLACSFEGVIGYEVTDEKSTAKTTTKFIEAMFRDFKSNVRRRPRRLVIVLDNGPKNKSAELKRMAENFAFELLFTIPNSPFLNFVENVFNAIKKRVYQQPQSKRSAR